MENTCLASTAFGSQYDYFVGINLSISTQSSLLLNMTEVSLSSEKYLGLTRPTCVSENARQLFAHEMSGLT